MRTALYVLKPTTVSIQPIDPLDHHAMLFAYDSNVPEQSAIGIINLTTGIYLITSRNQLNISGNNIHTENFEKDLGNEQLHQICGGVTDSHISIQGKEPPPDIAINHAKLEIAATHESIKQFFQIERGIEI